MDGGAFGPDEIVESSKVSGFTNDGGGLFLKLRLKSGAVRLLTFGTVAAERIREKLRQNVLDSKWEPEGDGLEIFRRWEELRPERTSSDFDRIDPQTVCIQFGFDPSDEGISLLVVLRDGSPLRFFLNRFIAAMLVIQMDEVAVRSGHFGQTPGSKGVH